MDKQQAIPKPAEKWNWRSNERMMTMMMMCMCEFGEGGMYVFVYLLTSKMYSTPGGNSFWLGRF